MIRNTVTQSIRIKANCVLRCVTGPNSPRIMPLGWAGGCQMSRTELVLTSGKRIPTGGPGTASSLE